MKTVQYIYLLTFVLVAGGIIGIVDGLTTNESIIAADKVFVSSAVFDPIVFFPGDRGTFTIDVTNGNTDKGIAVNHAQLSSETIKSTSQPYDFSTSIGPGQKQSYIFSITADGLEGLHYTTFSLSFSEADSLYYRAQVKIDSTPLVLTILDRPDTFSTGAKKTIYAQVANPRGNSIKNVILNISGTGITAIPSAVVVGTLTTTSQSDIENTKLKH